MLSFRDWRNVCKEKGLTRILLDVRESNEAARALYESAGFGRMVYGRDFMKIRRKMQSLMSRKIGE